MTRILILLAALATLAACSQHHEPKANCFTHLASTASVATDCSFTPLGAREGGIEV